MKETLSTLKCSNCTHENRNEAKFCQNCGQQLTIVCPHCGVTNEAEAKFCFNCGEALEPSTTIPETRLSELQQSAPEGLQEKMRASSSEIEGERKPVTILFTDIVGSTAIAEKLDPEVWKEIVSGAHRRVGEAIYRYEGTIAQLLGDGVLAFFGAPITHEDDPIRAVRAALDIQESIKDYEQELDDLVDSFKMRIGINTGEVVIGNIGTDMHMEYLALGDAVNIAARLQSTAEPGKVLLSGSSSRLLGDVFELRSLGEISVKGKEEPIESYELIGVSVPSEVGRRPQEYQTPYVGREDELEAFGSSLLRLRAGQGQIVSVIGEAGIGKTRLLEEVREILCKENEAIEAASNPPSSIKWLEGRALSYGGSLSYWTITQLLLADLGLANGASQVKIKVALRQRVEELYRDPPTEDLMPYIANLLGIALDGEVKDRLNAFDSETLKQQTHRAIREYFIQVAKEEPTVLIFEDMHWADPSSLEVLEDLLSLTDHIPLMILMVMRVDRDHPSWGLRIKAETDFHHRFTEIHLRRLSENESKNLVLHLLGSDDVPGEIWETIAARAEGNPFYIEEVLHHMVEDGMIIRDEQGWHSAKEMDEIGIPDTLQGILLARIDRLEEDVRHTLQMASVIGKSFLFRILEAISEAERELDSHLSELQRLDLVREKTRIPELEYIFRQTLTQEATYNSILHERRREFHQRVGEALETLFAERVEDYAGLLAYHFETAGESEKALRYLLAAGDKARFKDSLAEAIDYYERSLTIMDQEAQPSLASRTWLKLGLIHQMNFDFDAAQNANEAAFDIEHQSGVHLSESMYIADQSKGADRTLLVSTRARPSTLDPGKMFWVQEAFFNVNLFAGLVELDSGFNVVPHAARSWEVLDNATRYVFHLRDDVFWTDGSRVTAADFEWAWKRNLAPNVNDVMAPLLDDVIGARNFRRGKTNDPDSIAVRALDDRTFEVRLLRPAAYFTYITTLGITFPLPRAVIERFGDKWWLPDYIVSNGAYRLVQFDENNIKFTRNQSYFADHPGNLDGMHWWYVEDREKTIAEYLEGKSNVLWNIPSRKVPAEVLPEEIRYAQKSIGSRCLIFNPNLSPTEDIRIRRALVYALDREKILDSRDWTKHKDPRGGIVPRGLAGHSPELGHSINLEMAHNYLEEAGYPETWNIPHLEMITASGHGQKILEEVQRQLLTGLGLRSQIEQVPSVIHADKLGHIVEFSWNADYPDPDNFLRSSGIYTYLRKIGWRNSKYDEVIDEAAVLLDREERLRLYRQADKFLVNDEVLVYPISYTSQERYASLAKPWVKNLSVNSRVTVLLKEIMFE